MRSEARTSKQTSGRHGVLLHRLDLGVGDKQARVVQLALLQRGLGDRARLIATESA